MSSKSINELFPEKIYVTTEEDGTEVYLCSHKTISDAADQTIGAKTTVATYVRQVVNEVQTIFEVVSKVG